MKFYRIKGKSTSELDKIDENTLYDYLAVRLINYDNNGIGEGEIRFVDPKQLRAPLKINGWVLGSSIEMSYGWGASTLRLNVTDLHGKTNQIIMEEAVGCQSSYWGVSIVNRIVNEFRSIAANNDWKGYDKIKYKVLVQDQINRLLFQREEINKAITRLNNELQLLA